MMLSAGLVVAMMVGDGEIRVDLVGKSPSEKESLRWSPKGAKVVLSRDGKGEFRLGPKEVGMVGVKAFKNDEGRYDRLWVDLDRDGVEGEGEMFKGALSERTGRFWASFGPVDVRIPVGKEGARGYSMSFWMVTDPEEPDAELALRWSRRGWHEGVTEVDGQKAYVLVTEMEMDGVFDQRDAWYLARDRKGLLGSSSRGMEDHAWLDGKAYRVTKIDGDGRWVAFEGFDPGFTEEEEKTKRDPYAEDKLAKRAAEPVQFSHEYEKAMELAKVEGKPIFIDFEASWCGPCKVMDQLVYTAQDVVDASAGVVMVKVDGDLRRDLAKKYEVGAYPTMILLNEKGKEVRRAVGYRGVKAMVEFLNTGRITEITG